VRCKTTPGSQRTLIIQGATMKAILFDRFGAADVLKIGDAPEPVLRPHDLLVRTRAAGVNRADLTHRRGGYGRRTSATRPSWAWKSPAT
jgi:NADPH:quinone reductase-like Zn-dependent oxidoreductase